ncbi:MAG: LytTR family DNA-binding domain-containing protein [Myxococcota bacterium]
MSLRVVIAEDESAARRHIESLVEGAEGLELVGSSPDGRSAVELIDSERPDAVFIDVRMPRLSGIDVLRRVGHQPLVVFTTAFDEYAIAAFELGAVDYLLKPFGEERFARAAKRLLSRQPVGDDAPVPERLDAVRASPMQRLFARTGDRLVPIELALVQRLSAARDYTELHTHDADFLVRLPISDLEPRLDPSAFVRVHRSHIVNLHFVQHVDVEDPRKMVVALSNGDLVPVSRSGARLIRELAF